MLESKTSTGKGSVGRMGESWSMDTVIAGWEEYILVFCSTEGRLWSRTIQCIFSRGWKREF